MYDFSYWNPLNLLSLYRLTRLFRISDAFWNKIFVPVHCSTLIATSMKDLPAVVADWEPEAALRAGPAGTEAIEVLIDEVGAWLTSDGVFVWYPPSWLDLEDFPYGELEERAHLSGAQREQLERSKWHARSLYSDQVAFTK